VLASGAGHFSGSSQTAVASANVLSRSAVLQPGVSPGAGTGMSPSLAQPRNKSVAKSPRSALSSAQGSKNPLHKLSL